MKQNKSKQEHLLAKNAITPTYHHKFQLVLWKSNSLPCTTMEKSIFTLIRSIQTTPNSLKYLTRFSYNLFTTLFTCKFPFWMTKLLYKLISFLLSFKKVHLRQLRSWISEGHLLTVNYNKQFTLLEPKINS